MIPRSCFAAFFGFLLLTPAAFADQPLPRSTPAGQAVSPQGIMDFLAAMEAAKHELHSFMMLRRGHVIAEGWAAPYAPDLRHTMYSMSKSFASTAVGFAVAEGKLSVEDKVVSFFPEDLPEKVSDNLAALRVKDLLTMSVGNEKEPTQPVVKSENWVRTFLAQPITHKPGTVFMYNSAATYMCSAIVQKVTGQKIIDYLKPRLFEPLGITGATWEECPRAINTGGWGLSIRTEDMAKFGQLYLQRGEWRGKQILPETWIEEATSKHIQQPKSMKPQRPTESNDWQQGYGYQFWRCQNDAFRGDGAFGQFTIVLPAQETVIVMTEETKDMQAVLDLVWEHLLPAIHLLPEVANPDAEQRLRKALASLKVNPPKGRPTSSAAVAVTGKTYTLLSNPLGLTQVSFQFAGDTCTLMAKTGENQHLIQHGMEQWHLGETAFPGTPPRLISGGAPKSQPTSRLAASGTWVDDNTLQLTWQYLETPHHDTGTCEFNGDDLTMTFVNSLAEMRGKKEDERPKLIGRALP